MDKPIHNRSHSKAVSRSALERRTGEAEGVARLFTSSARHENMCTEHGSILPLGFQSTPFCHNVKTGYSFFNRFTSFDITELNAAILGRIAGSAASEART